MKCTNGCRSKCTCMYMYVPVNTFYIHTCTYVSQQIHKSNYCLSCKIVFTTIFLISTNYSILFIVLITLCVWWEWKKYKRASRKKELRYRSTVPIINTSSGKTETIKLSLNWDSISERRFKRGMKNKKVHYFHPVWNLHLPIPNSHTNKHVQMP